MAKIEGKLEDWHESHKLALRTQLGTGEVTINGVKIPFSISLNIDNRAFFVEFPEEIKVTYRTDDLVKDAIVQYESYLATKAFVVEQEQKKTQKT